MFLPAPTSGMMPDPAGKPERWEVNHGATVLAMRAPPWQALFRPLLRIEIERPQHLCHVLIKPRLLLGASLAENRHGIAPYLTDP
jgi:hypothetical protein